MNLTDYIYNENETPNNKIDPSALIVEIQNSEITIAIDGVTGMGDGYYHVIFKDELPNPDVIILNNVISVHSGEPIQELDLVKLDENRDDSGRLEFVPEKKAGIDLIVSTHNFCDPCTWYTGSERVENVLLSTNDGYRYDLPDSNIIDLYHGRILKEDQIAETKPHAYAIEITVDGYSVDEKDTYNFEPWDYYVNYEDGYVIFKEVQTGDVRASYSKANTSDWYLTPNSGKSIKVEKVIIQFSKFIIFTDYIDFDSVAYGSYIVERSTYKKVHNFMDEATETFTIMPPVDNLTDDLMKFPFPYNTDRTLNSSDNISLRIQLRHNIPYHGERATATFYCVVVDEKS
jgi:hypothetical protein